MGVVLGLDCISRDDSLGDLVIDKIQIQYVCAGCGKMTYEADAKFCCACGIELNCSPTIMVEKSVAHSVRDSNIAEYEDFSTGYFKSELPDSCFTDDDIMSGSENTTYWPETVPEDGPLHEDSIQFHRAETIAKRS